MRHFKGALAGLCLLALVACGAPGGTGTVDGGPVPPSTTSSASVDLRPAASQAKRPNIVVVMLDDFSMDLVQTMRSVQRMRKAGRELPALLRHRLAVLRLALELLHRAVPPPDRRTHQHLQPGHLDAGRLAGLRRQRQPRARLQRAAAGGRLQHRLRRQVPQRVRVVAGPRAAAGGAGLVDLQHRLRLRLRRLGLRQHLARRPAAAARPAPGAARERERRRQGPRLRRHRHRRPGDGLPPLRRGVGRALLPRGRALRPAQPGQPGGPLRRRPALPADVPRPLRRAQLRPGRVPQAHHRRPPRLRRPAQGQPPAPGRRQAGPRVEHRRVRSPHPSRSATCATARGWSAPPTGW